MNTLQAQGLIWERERPVTSTQVDKDDDARIVLGILDSVSRNRIQSQRLMAAELGIALGLVNAYLRRCIKKGLVKMKEAPARRYLYYLTPLGFSEKSRLTVEYLAFSLSFFRQAKMDCTQMLQNVTAANHRRVVLLGKSDLTEIVAICALDSGLEVVAVVDPSSAHSTCVGVPLCAKLDEVTDPYDVVIVTDLNTPQETYDAQVARLGEQRVFIPNLLRPSVEMSP